MALQVAQGRHFVKVSASGETSGRVLGLDRGQEQHLTIGTADGLRLRVAE